MGGFAARLLRQPGSQACQAHGQKAHSSWAGPKSNGHDALERGPMALGARGHALGRGGGELAGSVLA
jgi:hypothetical protein